MLLTSDLVAVPDSIIQGCVEEAVQGVGIHLALTKQESARLLSHPRLVSTSASFSVKFQLVGWHMMIVSLQIRKIA